ncbi:MAG: hypothetical protein IJ627_01745 [Bacteroidales bacterium]|nr:hypothetical protein [Bacteroidales bacterium]
MRRLIAVAVLLAAAISARAQFYTSGVDPASIRWMKVETDYYQVVYPEGADSLARVYATLLEQFRPASGRSLKVDTGARPGRKFPVVLHTRAPHPNGSVSWAPTRMDLYTTPGAYGPDPAPWAIQLIAHEPRHQAQLQYPYEGWTGVGSKIIGQGFNPVVWYVNMNHSLGEGDAVAAETGLAYGTRARTADFLNYYRVAFGEGDFRSWSRWRYGSFKNYTPDYYTIGYMTVAGERVFRNDPFAVRKALDATRRNIFRFAPYNLKPDFSRTAKAFADIWKADEDARGPFPEPERVSVREDFPVEFESLVSMGDELYAIRSGYTRNPQLVKYDDGEWRPLASFSTAASSLYPSEETGRLYWTETITNPRWEHDGKSIVRYFDTESGRVHDLTSSGRYYNPSPSEDGDALSVVSYLTDGRFQVLVLDADSGELTGRYAVPAGLQPTETAWTDRGLVAVCLGEEGFSLYEVGEWKPLFPPVRCKIGNLGGDGDSVEFVSDLSGVNELYSYDLESGEFTQETLLRYGGVDFVDHEDEIYFLAQTIDGRAVFKLPSDAFKERKADFSKPHTYIMEDVLTAQEDSLGGVDRSRPVNISEPSRYYKLGHPARLHSWAPVYINYNSIKSESFDFTYDNLSLGVTGFFQNTLGTLYGSVGYSLHPSAKGDGSWRNALHVKAVYEGLYPVFELNFDMGDSNASAYSLIRKTAGATVVNQTVSRELSAPVATASLSAYIPWRFYKGGIQWGLIPRVNYGISNNWYNAAPRIYSTSANYFADTQTYYRFQGFGSGTPVLLQSLSASLRAYVMTPNTESRVYPRLGIGLEMAARMRPGLTGVFSPSASAYVYGYLPGFYQTHGFRFTALVSGALNPDAPFLERLVDVSPRGFDDGASLAMVGISPVQAKFTADYAIPLYFGDISLMPVTYISNFVLTPHADYTLASGKGSLWSVGADLTAELKRLILSFDLSLGLSVDYMGGSLLGAAGQEGRWYIGPVFNLGF